MLYRHHDIFQSVVFKGFSLITCDYSINSANKILMKFDKIFKAGKKTFQAFSLRFKFCFLFHNGKNNESCPSMGNWCKVPSGEETIFISTDCWYCRHPSSETPSLRHKQGLN